MNLKEGILKAKQDFGVEIVYEKKLISILADYGVFKNQPSRRFIIKELILNNYIRDYIDSNGRDKEKIIAKLNFSHGFEKHLIREIIEAFQFEEINNFIHDTHINGIFCYKEKGNWGLKDFNENIIIPPNYAYLSEFSDGLCGFSNSRITNLAGRTKYFTNYGYLNNLNQIQINEEFDNISTFKFKRAIVSKFGKEGVINEFGEIIIPFDFYRIETLNPYLYKVVKLKEIEFEGDIEERRFYGLFNSSGLQILECKYEYLRYDSLNELLIGSINDKSFIITQEGRILQEFYNIYIELCTIKNFFIVSNKNQLFKYGISDINGELIIPISYNKIIYYNHIFRCKDNNYTDYYLIDGEKINKCPLLNGFNFINGYAIVQKENNKWFKLFEKGFLEELPINNILYVSSVGNILVSSPDKTYENFNNLQSLNESLEILDETNLLDFMIDKSKIYEYPNGIIRLEANNEDLNMKIYVYINGINGKIIYKGELYSVKNIYKNVLLIKKTVKENHKSIFSSLQNENALTYYFLIDLNSGKLIGKKYNSFQSVDKFSCDRALFSENGKYGYLNCNGEIAIKPIFDDANSFINDYAVVKKGDKWGIINLDGEVIVPIKYEEIKNIQRDFYEV